MASPFLAAFVGGAAVLALWVDARFPGLAPQSFSRRFFAAILAFALLQASPFVNGSAIEAYGSLFGIVLPAFIGVFLTAVWLIRALRDAAQTQS
jgi:cytosine/uracil/thiamine/allantoin permease